MEYQPFSAKIRISRLFYYINTLFKLFDNMRPSYRMKFVQDILIPSGYRQIYFKNGIVFKMKTLLDILTLKEVVLDDEYQNYGVRVSGTDRVIVDIGAGFGDFSIMIAKKFPRAKIFAFEPDPSYFSLLKQNITLNFVKNVYPIKASVHYLKQVISSPRIDFLKMDCEGCEFGIIIDKDIERLKKIKKIILEYHESGENMPSKLNRILKRAGFKVRIYPHAEVDHIGFISAFVP